MSRVNNKEKYKEYDHNYYIKHKRPKSKIGQAELKIADLEAKLAEKENEIKTLICDYESRITKTHELMSWLEHENEELKQQLAEKENMHLLDEKEFQHYCAYKHIEPEIKGCLDREREYEKQLIEKDKEIERLKQQLEEKQKTINEINKEFVQAVHDWEALCKKKDKEISRLKERLSVFDKFKDNYGYTNYDDSEILEDLQSRAFQSEDDTRVVNELLQFFNIFDENELVDKVEKPQTQLAIQELEKVKNFVDGRTYCANYIKKRIKELKGD